MLKAYLNYLTRSLTERYRGIYKRNFYNNLYLTGNNSGGKIFFRIIKIFYLSGFLIIVAASFIAVLNKSKPWWFPLGVILALLVWHFIITVIEATRQTSYMWTKVLIPKRYNKIALSLVFLLFALTIYILYLYSRNY